MSTYHVLIVFDTELIMRTYGKGGTLSAPIQIMSQPPTGIYMVTRSSIAISGQGGGELTVGVVVGDEIRWRPTSLALGAQHSVLLYDCFVYANGNQNCVSTPMINGKMVYSVVPILGPTPGSIPIMQTSFIDDVYWSCKALKATPKTGTLNVEYHFKFQIEGVGNTGEPTILGYYEWDPFIVINNPTTK
jgi:hypothetical protein